jgi:uncharacterized protein
MTPPPDERLEFVELMLSELRTWAERERPARGAALVGSYASGAAHRDSDVDVVILVDDPEAFVRERWLGGIDWRRLGASPVAAHLAQYGDVWSNHVRLDNSLEVEFGFAPLSWAGGRPLDSGARQVISDGCRILYDPDGLLGAACAKISNGSRQERRSARDSRSAG